MAITATPEMINPADVQALAAAAERDALDFVALNKVDVTDLVSLDRAVRIRAAIGEKKNSIVEKLAKPKSWAYGLHRWFCALESSTCRPLDELDAYERQAIADYKREQDRLRQAEEQRLAEERHRLEQDLAAAEAARLEAAGEPEVARAILAEAIAAPPPIVALADITRQVSGLKFRTTWKWRYVGNNQARAMQLIPREYLAVDEQKIGAVVRGLKGMTKIPGIEAYSVEEPVR